MSVVTWYMGKMTSHAWICWQLNWKRRLQGLNLRLFHHYPIIQVHFEIY